ncbi:2Fe-2S iron-sulfur cluster binding domain-containing protein [Mycolicibacterium sp. 624]|uniref:2Fe-2S iron-sulfur cluster-binding protein n=1 Tax=Mycolicibacterium sp. 624 TaxID=3156314 RepID=UPI003394491F
MRLFSKQNTSPTQPNTPSGYTIRLLRVGTTVEAAGGGPILPALERAGIHPEFFCRNGICGTCKAHVIRGTPIHGDAVLTDDEKHRGDILICVSSATPGSTVVLDL